MFFRKSLIFFYYLFLFILTRIKKYFINLYNYKVSIDKYGVLGLVKFYLNRDFNPSKSKTPVIAAEGTNPPIAKEEK